MNSPTSQAVYGEEKRVYEMKNAARDPWLRYRTVVKRLFRVIHEVAGFSLSRTAGKVLLSRSRGIKWRLLF